MNLNLNQVFKQLTLIWGVLLAGIISFAVVVFYLNGGSMLYKYDESDAWLTLVAAILVLISIGTTKYLVNFYKGKCKEKEAVKFNCLRSSFIIGLAMLELPIILCIVFYLISGSFHYMGLAFVPFVYFLTQKPNLNILKLEWDM